MRGKSWLILLAALFVFHFAGGVFAGSLLGPEKFTRTKGKPDVYSAEFNATSKTGLLRILNGEESGSNQVTSAYIYLNDTALLAPNDFKNKANHIIEKQIPLEDVNTLRVDLRSEPGSFLSLEISQQGLSVDLVCTPDRIYDGDEATLFWTSSNADKVSIDNGIGEVPLAGSQIVSPANTVTYTITATGPEGSVSHQAILTVIESLQPPTINLNASDTNIIAGESLILSWSSTNADSYSITPGIGTVAPNGTRTVTPMATTTYSITATGPGGSATDNVTITVDPIPAPTATFTADPATITASQSSTLSWTTQNAESVTISPEIGAVAASGSHSVNPADTTTYTLTATGPGGTVNKSVIITVSPILPPAVTITADPASILTGQSSTLTWTSTNATDVVIDQGIGQVSASGSISVSPAETTTYTMTVTGPGGTATGTAMVTVTPLSVSIISPSNGDMISTPAFMVQGTITNPLGNEVGITVNGVVALVYGDQFAANYVPLDEGQNSITVTAIDAEGNTASASISVNAAINADSIGIPANPEMGVSPFEATLTVAGTFSITNPVFEGTGPGDVEIINGTEANEYIVRMTTPGIYIFNAEAADDQGYVHRGTLALQILNREEIDAVLQAKWNRMKSALAGGDIEGAVKYFSKNSQPIYRQQFTDLLSVLDQIAADMGAITFINTDGNQAIYDLRTIRNGKTYSFQLMFIREEEGIWHIRNF